jgi:hypothetical protein
MFRRLRRFLRAALILVAFMLVWSAPSRAVNASAFISGTVTQDGLPVAHVQVTATGNNQTAKTTTDARGHFGFPPLALGTYVIEAKSGDHQGAVRVDLSGGGAVVGLTLVPLKEIGSVVATSGASSTGILSGSGSNVTLNHTQLTEMPYNNSFSEMEIQMPGAARGANGVVHINGDHGVINYMIDGVPLPQELNRDIGSEINLNDLSFVDLIEGAYPAQYGLRFGSVFNMSTRAGTGPPASTATSSYGSYGTAISTIGYHAPLAGGGGLRRRGQRRGRPRGARSAEFQLPAQRCELGQSVRALHAP